MAKFQDLVGTVKDRLGRVIEKDSEIADPTQDAVASKPISRAQAKRDLEALIAEKLSKMSEKDLEELFVLQQRQLQAQKNGEIAITSLEDLGLEAEPVEIRSEPIELVAEAYIEPVEVVTETEVELEAEPAQMVEPIEFVAEAYIEPVEVVTETKVELEAEPAQMVEPIELVIEADVEPVELVAEPEVELEAEPAQMVEPVELVAEAYIEPVESVAEPEADVNQLHFLRNNILKAVGLKRNTTEAEYLELETEDEKLEAEPVQMIEPVEFVAEVDVEPVEFVAEVDVEPVEFVAEPKVGLDSRQFLHTIILKAKSFKKNVTPVELVAKIAVALDPRLFLNKIILKTKSFKRNATEAKYLELEAETVQIVEPIEVVAEPAQMVEPIEVVAGAGFEEAQAESEAEANSEAEELISETEEDEAALDAETEADVEPIELVAESEFEEVQAEAEAEELISETEEEVALDFEDNVELEAKAVAAAIADQELTSKVEEFYRGFEEEEREKLALDGTFKENFLVCFDYFASGAMLEAAANRRKAFFRKVGKRIDFIKNDIKYIFSKIFRGPAKQLSRFGAFISKRFKTKEEKKREPSKAFAFLGRGEQAVSNQMANAVTALDKGTAVMARGFIKAVHRSSRRALAVREWADVRKKYLLTILFVLMLCGITAVSVVNYFTAYIYAYNGKPLGVVKSQHDVLRVLDIVNTQLSREHGTYIAIDPERDLTFYRVVSTTINNEIDDMQDVFNRLTYMQDISTIAYAFYIEGRRMAVLDSEETIDSILNDYINFFLVNNGMADIVFDEIGFVEELDSRPIDTQLGRLNRASDILERLRAGTMTEKIHVVERGQTFSGIAVMHGVTQAELRDLNPTVTPARLSIGQEIILQQAVPLITIESVETSTFSEPIPYEVIYEDNPNAFVGENTTRIAGVLGERQVTARITRQNGIEMDRVDLAYQTLSEPSSAVVVRGTRPVPPRQGTGQLRRPLPPGTYRLSSPFGMRWGRMHNGVDWAAPRGTRVGAADGGTVTFSGYRGAFGNLIIINHGGGIETYYAHLNRRLVRTGEQVFQGQHIGDVGSTGRSTGPHLHFEVRVHGVPQNPLRFL